MVPVILLLFAASPSTPDGGARPPSRPSRAPVTVSGTASRVHETSPCRGGAMVSPEELQRETAALAEQVLTVFAGHDLTGKVVARPKTDRSGRFSLKLPPGPYCLVVGAREPVPAADAGQEDQVAAPRAAGANLDPACLAELANPTPRCDANLLVQEGQPLDVPVVLFSSNRCTQQWAHPCWRGPMPPGARREP